MQVGFPLSGPAAQRRRRASPAQVSNPAFSPSHGHTECLLFGIPARPHGPWNVRPTDDSFWSGNNWGARVSNEVDVLRAAIRDFKRSVEITRDVRFQANLRLSRRQRGSSYIVAMLSLYVIGLSLLPNILQLSSAQAQVLLACSIVLSVFVIFTSLIDGAQNFFHQGELLHQCARKIATIHLALKNIDVDADRGKAQSEFEKLQHDYQKALDECPINHDNVDYLREMGWKPHLFPDNYPKWEPLRAPYAILLKVRATMGGLNWMTIHICSIIIVTGVAYFLVIRGAVLKLH